MKKIYMFLAALLVSLSAVADRWHLIGYDGDWEGDNAIAHEFTYNSLSGCYELDITFPKSQKWFRIIRNTNTNSQYSISSDTTDDVVLNLGDSQQLYSNDSKAMTVNEDSGLYGKHVVLQINETNLTLSVKEYVSISVNGTAAPKLSYYDGSNWTTIDFSNKISDTEYSVEMTNTHNSTQNQLYYGIIDSNGNSFHAADITLSEGVGSATSFTAVSAINSLSQSTISGVKNGGKYVFNIKQDGENVTLSVSEVAEPVGQLYLLCLESMSSNNWIRSSALAQDGDTYTIDMDFSSYQGAFFVTSNSATGLTYDGINGDDCYGVSGYTDYTGWVSGTPNNVVKGKYSFLISVKGVYTITVQTVDGVPSTVTITNYSVDEPDDQDLVYDVPVAAEELDDCYVSVFTKSGKNDKVLTAGVTSVVSGLYSWAKYEDDEVYTSGNGTTDGATLHDWSDNPATDEEAASRPYAVNLNHTATHDCRNFSDAYYRFYLESESKPGTKAAATTLSSRASSSRANYAARIARTTRAADNTTGVDDIIVDGGSVEDSEAPVVYYNLQGVQVKNPSTGLYIRVQGKKADKVYIR